MPGVELCRDILVTKEVDGASHHKQAGVNFIFIILEQEDISIYARLMGPPSIHGRTGDVRSEAVVDCEIWWFRLCNRTAKPPSSCLTAPIVPFFVHRRIPFAACHVAHFPNISPSFSHPKAVECNPTVKFRLAAERFRKASISLSTGSPRFPAGSILTTQRGSSNYRLICTFPISFD